MKEISTVIAVAAFVFGIWIGSEAYNESWIKDCDRLGMHRVQEKVYQCKPAAKKEQEHDK